MGNRVTINATGSSSNVVAYGFRNTVSSGSLTAGTNTVTVSTGNSSIYAPGGVQCNQGFTWSGLTSSSGPVVGTAPSLTYQFFYKVGVGAVQSVDVVVPESTLQVTWNAFPTYQYSNFWLSQNFLLNVNRDTGVGTLTNPYTPQPLNTLEKFFGQTLNVPYYVAAGVESVAVEINGVTHNFPVDIQEGDSGGVAMLAIPIPQGWNGAAKINGADVALAPRVAYTGSPTMGLTANPYMDATEPLALPAGMSRGVPALPAGITPQTYYGLPAGMTVGTKLPLPSGVTAISQTAPVGGTLPVGVTSTGGSKGWVTIGPTQTATSTGGTTSVSDGSSTGAGSELSDADKEAIGEAGAVGDYGDKTEAGTGLKGLGTQWDSLKVTAQNKFGTFRPMASGSLPKATSLDMMIPFGPLGTRSVNIDLTQPPFSTARALALVLLIAGSGWWFLKFVKV